MIITRFSQLIKAYHGLGAGDVFVGKIPKSHLKSTLLADLTDRGVRLLPSATAQLLNGSKAAQAWVLAQWMAPHTLAITRRKELLDAITRYNRLGIQTAVTKRDRLHCGYGLCKWDNLETLYSCLAYDPTVFPFVLQPYVAASADVRVIVVGDFYEAYCRTHPYNFRMNLAAGGRSHPHALTPEQHGICQQVLERSQLPYGHIDLMLTRDSDVYLSEIRLNGGIQGAQVEGKVLNEMKQAHLMALANRICDSNGT